jgi:NADP-dependent 3-hydroxy acid dehydrogenase YdfG
MRPLASGEALPAGSLLPAHLVVDSSYHVASDNSLNSQRLNMSKTILITGASSGFGRDTAETLRRAGHAVYASMRGAHGKNREPAGALQKLGIKTVEIDVSDDASVEAGVTSVLAEAGKIDVLVNNAGIGSAGVTEAFTAEQAKVIFDTNVIGVLRVTRAVLPAMRQHRDGLIINIGSILGRVTFPFVGLYGASKFAVEALTDSLRYEVSQFGVEVVEVQPSTYPTNFLTSSQTPAGTEVARSYGEIGRIPGALVKSLTSTFEGKDAPNPHDVAEAIVTLVGQSKGSRAVRTVVGAPFGSDQANQDVAPVQAKVVEALGLSYLEKVA